MSAPSPEIRIKLEGRLEVLEAALRRYAELEQRVGGQWQRRVIEERTQVLEALSHEPSIDAALEAADRIADAPVRALMKKLVAYRTELAERLDRPTWREAALRLRETAESVRLPGTDEVVLLSGTAERAIPMWLIVAVPALLGWWALGWMAAAGIVVSAACLALAVIPLGTYSVLADRLVWVPYSGVPVEVPLGELKAIAHHRRGLTLDAGGRTLRLPAVEGGDAMLALLLLYRDGPLKGIARPPSGITLIRPAVLAMGATEEGHALLHPDGFFFLPRGGASGLLKRLIDRRDLDVGDRFVLEQLSRLPADRLTDLLATVTDLPGAVNGRADKVLADPIRGGKLRLRVGMTMVDVSVAGVDSVALATNLPWTKAP